MNEEHKHLSSLPLAQLKLSPSLHSGLKKSGYTYCTPIQAKALPLALNGQDIAGQAQTGTGKTAAFLLATFQRLLDEPASPKRKPNQPRALILAPTRELAIQIHKDAALLGADTGLTLALTYGGADYRKQREQLMQSVDILIGTPGRIIDYFKQRVFDLRAIQVVVLDEADRMFDLGFIKDIRYLLRHCPKPERRLNLLFSATLPYRVTELAYEHMNNPQIVAIESDSRTADKIRQTVMYPALEEKVPLLLGLLTRLQPEKSIIFTNTKQDAEKVCAYLNANNREAAILSGDVPQKKRQRLLQRFTEGELNILVATDVAARGLHIPDVSHVFNFDLPQSAEDYVHRVGRTARIGASGRAISFACERYAHYLPDIEEYIGQRIESEPVTTELLVTPLPPAKPKRRRSPHQKHPNRRTTHPKTANNEENHPGQRENKPRRRKRKTPPPTDA